MSIVVSELTKIYGKQKAVDDISFEVKSGEILGFLGPNGAGKSTTMKIATGYIPPSKGRIKVFDFDVVTQSMEVRRNIGYLPEHNPLYLDMYVKEYLRFIGSLHHIKRKKLSQRVSEMIEVCGLEREQKKLIGALSKGYRQRVGLAQALIHDPPVLILDEPTTGLDPNQIVEIRNLIAKVGKEKTVIFSTHIMQEVQAICDRAIIINLGKIVADDSVESLKNISTAQSIIHLEVEGKIEKNIFLKIKGIEKIEQIDEQTFKLFTQKGADLRKQIAQLVQENDAIILGMRQEETTLETVFQKLTQ